jgi:hypothetical protein
MPRADLGGRMLQASPIGNSVDKDPAHRGPGRSTRARSSLGTFIRTRRRRKAMLGLIGHCVVRAERERVRIGYTAVVGQFVAQA